MARELVTLRRIADLKPIPQADNIVCALVDGWTVVVRKAEFAVGDPCLFFEIDSFIPAADARFDFLAKSKRSWRGIEGYGLRTMKLKKQLSQGLALPVGPFAGEIAQFNAAGNTLSLAQLLQVQLWEAEAAPQQGGKEFPHFIPKTDAERIQNIYHELDPAARYDVSVKEDGSSLTVYKRDGIVGVCSRNFELLPDAREEIYQRAARESGLLEVVAQLSGNLAVQAEIVGPGMNGNRSKYPALSVRIFNIFDIDAQRSYSMAQRLAAVQPRLDGRIQLLHAPVVGTIGHSQIDTLDKALAFADGLGETGLPREGVVLKRTDGSGSIKIISNQYLLQHGL